MRNQHQSHPQAYTHIYILTHKETARKKSSKWILFIIFPLTLVPLCLFIITHVYHMRIKRHLTMFTSHQSLARCCDVLPFLDTLPLFLCVCMYVCGADEYACCGCCCWFSFSSFISCLCVFFTLVCVCFSHYFFCYPPFFTPSPPVPHVHVHTHSCTEFSLDLEMRKVVVVVVTGWCCAELTSHTYVSPYPFPPPLSFVFLIFFLFLCR